MNFNKSILLNKKDALIYEVLIFFIVFAFPIIPVFSSAKIVMLYIVSYMLLTKKIHIRINEFGSAFKYFPRIYFLVFFYTIAMAVLSMSFETTLINKVISSFILYFISFCVLKEGEAYVNIPNTVICCFVIQSFFILLAIFSEDFYLLTQPFRGELSFNLEQSYGRLRGNAICGYQFFGIASMYTFVIVYLLLHLENYKWGWLTLIILGIAAMCSGRFSIVGYIIGFLILCYKKLRERNIGKVILIILCIVAVLIISIAGLYYYIDQISDPIMYKVISNYLIDPIDSVLSDGAFQSSSTDTLMDMYKNEDIKKYFITGAGQYEMPDGSYFGGVDIGYYRMLGYYGICGFLIITYAIYYLIYKTKNTLDIFTKHAFFLTFLVLNIKGDVQIFNNNIIPLLVAFIFFSNDKKLLI